MDVERNAKKLSCSRNCREDSYGVVRDGTPLRSLGAVAVLRKCPKFGAKSRKRIMNLPSSSHEDSNDGSEVTSNQEATPKKEL